MSGEPAGDRFLISVGVLSLLAEAAGDHGLVCVVDYAQWLDRPSAEALVFCARRLGAEGVAMIFAVREGERAGSRPPAWPSCAWRAWVARRRARCWHAAATGCRPTCATTC